jgi:hypothetical protein
MSKSVSPATFLMPGIMKAEPAKPLAEPTLPAVPPSDKTVQS